MNLALDYSALENQIGLAEEERRYVFYLKDKLESMYRLGMITDISTYRRAKNKLGQLDRAVSRRKTWLENTLETFKGLQWENRDMFEKEEVKIRRLLS